MTEMTKEIRVPVWLITLGCAIAIAAIGAIWRVGHSVAQQAVIQGKIIEQVERLRWDVDNLDRRTRSAVAELEKNKVDRREYDRMCVQLDRIEIYMRER